MIASGFGCKAIRLARETTEFDAATDGGMDAGEVFWLDAPAGGGYAWDEIGGIGQPTGPKGDDTERGRPEDEKAGRCNRGSFGRADIGGSSGMKPLTVKLWFDPDSPC